MPEPSSPRSLGQLLKDTAAALPDKKALYHKINNVYVGIPWKDVFVKVRVLAAFLASQGLRKGDRVALLSENRPEWLMTDLAAQTLGVATVPIYTSLSCPEIEYILNDAGVSWVAVSDKNLFQKLIQVQRALPSLKAVLVFDSAVQASASDCSVPVHHFDSVCRAQGDPPAWRDDASPDDLASIIYTSGTTDKPKGVMLTHKNFIHNVLLCKEAFRMDSSDAHLSFLPLSHVFERTAGYYLMLYIGASIAYAENLDTVPKNIQETRPTFLLGVPRFYEKIQTRMIESVKTASRSKQKLFAWAKALGEKKRSGSLGLFDRLIGGPVADLLVSRKIRARLGGKLRFCVSGGAPLRKDIAEYFCDLGLMIYEGYGLTETSPVIAANREGRVRFGTVGIPLRTVDVTISGEGEILTRSECVMRGYFNKPAETQQAIQDGWFHTGDLGRFDEDGFLVITGRKKELIVTSGGKKVSPRPIEEKVEKDPFVLRCVLFGEGQRFITALIVPNKETLLGYASDHKIDYQSYEDLLSGQAIQTLYESRIRSLMTDLAPYEQIKYFVLLAEDFTQAAGELTPTLKVKREVVHAKYKERLLPLYQNERA